MPDVRWHGQIAKAPDGKVGRPLKQVFGEAPQSDLNRFPAASNPVYDTQPTAHALTVRFRAHPRMTANTSAPIKMYVNTLSARWSAVNGIAIAP